MYYLSSCCFCTFRNCERVVIDSSICLLRKRFRNPHVSTLSRHRQCRPGRLRKLLIDCTRKMSSRLWLFDRVLTPTRSHHEAQFLGRSSADYFSSVDLELPASIASRRDAKTSERHISISARLFKRSWNPSWPDCYPTSLPAPPVRHHAVAVVHPSVPCGPYSQRICCPF